MRRSRNDLVGFAAALTLTAALTACSSGHDTAQKASGSTAHPSAAVSPSATPRDLRSAVGVAPAPKLLHGLAYGTPSTSAVQGAATISLQFKQLSTGRIVRGVDGRPGVDIIVVGL